ncbi:MAG: amidase [Burkholderiales bacterium]|nr:amidase [Burkholderiales bacterium]
MHELIRLTAREAVDLLWRRELSPLDLVEASARRIAEVDPIVNAMPILCLDRAREHARRLMQQRASGGERPRGWLGGLPIAIKDLMDVAGVRTTYGSELFKDNVAQRSHPLVERIEALGAIVIGKSNTPEFGVGGNTVNTLFGSTRNPWNTRLTAGGSTGGGAAALAAGEIWLAQGTDHGGSLRRPASYCSVVGMRCSPGRITRGSARTLWTAQVVQGPMARNVEDLALFLDAMAGFCPHDPLTFEAPAVGFSDAVRAARAPKRIAYTGDFGGKVAVDHETRDICARMVRQFETLGCVVDEASPDVTDADEVFLVLRGQNFLVERESLLDTHREQLKPDLVWNIERGRQQNVARLAWAERERSKLYQRVVALLQTHELLITPAATTPAWDVGQRHPPLIDGVKPPNIMAASLLNSIITLTGLPSLVVPCGFDQFGRPIGLQITGRPRGEAAVLQAGALFEQMTGLARRLPIDPAAGVPAPGDPVPGTPPPEHGAAPSAPGPASSS